MQELPHTYVVNATANVDGNVNLSSDGVPKIESAAPAEFGGPGDRWSPETLLVAAVADCFILTFKAIARASKVDWRRITCDVKGKLEKVDNVTRFTHFALTVELHVPETVDTKKAARLLEKSEQVCLITNSMTSSTTLHSNIQVIV